MKPLFIGFLASILLVAGAARAEGELHIYNWRGYTNPMLLERFALAYNVAITVDEYQSNDELLTTLRAGNTEYDIVVPSDSTVTRLIEAGLLAETQPNQMSNFKNVDPRWADVPWDPGRRYSVPYHWGTTSLAVDTESYKGDLKTLKLLFDPPQELDGKIAVVDSGGDVVQAALRYLSLPPCIEKIEDYEQLVQLLTNAKQHWHSIAYDVTDLMLSSEVALAYTWNGNVMGVQQQQPKWQYVYPREGVLGWMDNVVVPKNAPNTENAKLFQNFVMAPENAGINSAYNGFANAILGSEKFLPPEFSEAPAMKLPDDAPAPRITPACSQEVSRKYEEIWIQLTR